jgi:GxxExxY protein
MDWNKNLYKESDLTEKIIGIAMKVHRGIGPGFQERVYHQGMILALQDEQMVFESEKEFDVLYLGRWVGTFRVDLLVVGKIIIELKSVCGEMSDLFKTQLISYLKASGIEIGLLINFGNRKLEIKRLAHYHNYYSV